MKKYLAFFAVLGLLVACQGKENPSGGGEVTAISLNKTSMNLEKGANEVLTVTFTPSNASNKTVTWVSTKPEIATVNDGIVMGVNTGSTEIFAKCGNASAKCDVSVVISATSVSLSETSISLKVGDTRALSVMVIPSYSTDKLELSSSSVAVATTSSSFSSIAHTNEGTIYKGGTVKAVGEGTAIITAKVGSLTAECAITVTQKDVPPEGAVDLGVGNIYWATCNLGASKPEETGDFYAWGKTEPYYSSLSPLTWKPGKEKGYERSSYSFWAGYDENDWPLFTKYCSNSLYWGGDGSLDNKHTLDLEDDPAHVKLGGKWRMPTSNEFELLLRDSNISVHIHNGAVKIESNRTGNSIYLPTGDCWVGIDRINNAAYWTNYGYNTSAYMFERNLDGGIEARVSKADRWVGLMIRPVCDK